jgi:hypothetical protein
VQDELISLRLVELLNAVRTHDGLAELHLSCTLLLRHGEWGRRAELVGLLPEAPPGHDSLPPPPLLPAALHMTPPLMNGLLPVDGVARTSPLGGETGMLAAASGSRGGSAESPLQRESDRNGAGMDFDEPSSAKAR